MEGFLFCFSLILTLGPLQGRHVSACVQRNFQLLFVTRSSLGKEATSWQCGPTTAGGDLATSLTQNKELVLGQGGWVTWIGRWFEVVGHVGTHVVPEPYETLKSMLRLQVRFPESRRRTEVWTKCRLVKESCSSLAPRPRLNWKRAVGPSSLFSLPYILCLFDLGSETEGLCSFSNRSPLHSENIPKYHIGGEPARTSFVLFWCRYIINSPRLPSGA